MRRFEVVVTEHGFKAEVQQLLDLMIHSVYSDREVFLRELISNAADALDKARFLELTRRDLRLAGEEPGVRVVVDAVAKTITITDDGIGMTEAEAVENLGTIARSGTKAFVAAHTGSEGAPNLIGQFGLGFYASFMVADRVVVQTLSAEPDSTPVRWESAGKGAFEVGPGDRATRGTAVTLFLREDAAEFADAPRLRTVVRKHSNFLPWTVFVDQEKANAGRALWMEPANQVSDADANEFYKQISFDWSDPALRMSFAVDSPVQVRSLLFVPARRPYDLFHQEAVRGPRLHARRILIDEHARDLLPDWLRFVRGVVDCEDLPLNVSREMVQKAPVVRKLRDLLTKRVLKEFEKHAKLPAEGDTAPKVGWDAIWREFGVLLKEGFWHASTEYGDALRPLLRFHTTTCEGADGLRSLADILAARVEGQEAIWYLTASSREAALASPHLEVFRKKGHEVILLTDPVDEWLVQVLDSYEGVPIKSASRGELDLGHDDNERVDLTAFAPWAKDILGDAVTDVRASSRLTDSAVVLVDADDGMSANMERILRSANQQVGAARRVLELNTAHPLVRNLCGLHEAGKADAAAPIMRMLLDEALLLDGSVTDAPAMGRRLQDILLTASSSALRS